MRPEEVERELAGGRLCLVNAAALESGLAQERVLLGFLP